MAFGLWLSFKSIDCKRHFSFLPLRRHIEPITEYVTRSLIEEFERTCSALSKIKTFTVLYFYLHRTDYFTHSQTDNRLNLQIVGTIAWRWFTRKITQKIASFSPEPNMMDAITDIVQTKLSPRDTVEGTHLSYDVTFEVAWDPITFIKDQCYDDSPHEAIARAITLIGTVTEARAVSSAQYIKEMWPFSGESVMRLVQGVVSGRPDLPSCENLI